MRISAVIPCFNREERIVGAIDSALGQNPPPLEVLVVDDGSTDRSAEVAESYGEPVRVVRTLHRGQPAARNTGIAEARGDWVAFLDSDDEWLEGKLRLQAEAAARFPHAALIFCDSEAHTRGQLSTASRFSLGGVYGSERQRQGEFLLFDRSLFLAMLEQSRIFPSTVLVRRELPELHFIEEMTAAVDWPIWLRLVLRYPFAAVDQVLVRMHYDGDNISSRYAPIGRAATEALERLQEDEPELTAHERSAVREALGRRRLGAIYHSLVDGEPHLARPLLRKTPSKDLGRVRWLLYWLLSRLPAPLVAALARARTGGKKPPADERS